MADVFLHVGLYKTGTTTIQGALGATADQLAAAGVLFPGGHRAQRLAAYDLLGQRVAGEQRGEAAGALGRLVDLSGVAVGVGEPGMVAVATEPDARMVVAAAVGAVGLVPTYRALEAGKDVALANKIQALSWTG